MKYSLTEKIKELSDSYSFELWNRYRERIPEDETERETFALFDKYITGQDMSSIQDYGFTNDFPGPLPQSMFAPGCTAGIFINYHNAFMNNVIHSHDFFEIIYVCRGSISDWVDGTDIHLKTGDLCIHNPNARHKITKMDASEDFILNILLPQDMFQRSFYEMLFEDRELDRFFNSFMLSPDGSSNFMVFRNPPPSVDTITELIVEEFLRGKNASRFIFEATFVVLFGELLRNHKSDTFSRDLVSYISDRLDCISIQDAASHFGYHKNYFTNVVKEHTGCRFNELVTKIRLQRAVSLLLFTSSPLEEISEKLGYKSTASFYCHFKEAYKMTPSKYRQLHRSV